MKFNVSVSTEDGKLVHILEVEGDDMKDRPKRAYIGDVIGSVIAQAEHHNPDFLDPEYRRVLEQLVEAGRLEKRGDAYFPVGEKVESPSSCVECPNCGNIGIPVAKPADAETDAAQEQVHPDYRRLAVAGIGGIVGGLPGDYSGRWGFFTNAELHELYKHIGVEDMNPYVVEIAEEFERRGVPRAWYRDDS